MAVTLKATEQMCSQTRDGWIQSLMYNELIDSKDFVREGSLILPDPTMANTDVIWLLGELAEGRSSLLQDIFSDRPRFHGTIKQNLEA